MHMLYTQHSAVPQPGRSLQQPYIAGIGVTPWASEYFCAHGAFHLRAYGLFPPK